MAGWKYHEQITEGAFAGAYRLRLAGSLLVVRGPATAMLQQEVDSEARAIKAAGGSIVVVDGKVDSLLVRRIQEVSADCDTSGQ